MKRGGGLLFAAGMLTIAAATAACGGGGSHAAPVQSQSSGLVSGSAVMVIPNSATSTSSGSRKPQFLSASTVSVGVTVNGGTPTYANVSSSSSLCTTTSSGRSCTIPLTAPAGNVTFVFTLYDGANGTGNVLGTGTSTQTVAIGTPYTVTVAVSGVVGSLAVSVPVIDVGPTSVPVTVTAKDADGNTIIGSAAYPNPITLTNSDTTGTLTLSTTTVTSPSTVVMLNYTGAALQSPAKITASATGIPVAASSPASVLPLNYFPTGLTRSYSYAATSSSTNYTIGSPSPTPSAVATSGSYTDSISAGASFNGSNVLQAVAALGEPSALFGLNSFAVYGPVLTTTYQGLQNSSLTVFGGTFNSGGSQGTITYPAGIPYAALPFVSSAVLTGAPAFSETETSSYYYAPAISLGTTTGTTVTTQSTFTGSSSNITIGDTYSDGSTYSETDNADGSGSITLGAGTGTCSGYWTNNLLCTMSSATVAETAPAGGNITFTVTQVSSGVPQTSTVTVPVSSIYPNGLPPNTYSVTTTVGAPITTPPAPCAVTASFSGPIVPVTIASVYWYLTPPALVWTTTEVDYLAPSIGLICATFSATNQEVFTPNALNSLPLASPGPFAAYTYTYSETDSLTNVGPPTQLGTVIATGRARASLSGGAELPRSSPFLRRAQILGRFLR